MVSSAGAYVPSDLVSEYSPARPTYPNTPNTPEQGTPGTPDTVYVNQPDDHRFPIFHNRFELHIDLTVNVAALPPPPPFDYYAYKVIAATTDNPAFAAEHPSDTIPAPGTYPDAVYPPLPLPTSVGVIIDNPAVVAGLTFFDVGALEYAGLDLGDGVVPDDGLPSTEPPSIFGQRFVLAFEGLADHAAVAVLQAALEPGIIALATQPGPYITWIYFKPTFSGVAGDPTHFTALVFDFYTRGSIQSTISAKKGLGSFQPVQGALHFYRNQKTVQHLLNRDRAIAAPRLVDDQKEKRLAGGSLTI